jgi:hypothetical protein
MGNYSEIVFSARLRKDTPEKVLDFLEWYFSARGIDEKYGPGLPDHEFFTKPRWDMLPNAASASYTSPFSRFKRKISERDFWAGYPEIQIRCNIKNYAEELESFVDWILPYTDGDGYGDTLYGYIKNSDGRYVHLIFADGIATAEPKDKPNAAEVLV